MTRRDEPDLAGRNLPRKHIPRLIQIILNQGRVGRIPRHERAVGRERGHDAAEVWSALPRAIGADEHADIGGHIAEPDAGRFAEDIGAAARKRGRRDEGEALSIR